MFYKYEIWHDLLNLFWPYLEKKHFQYFIHLQLTSDELKKRSRRRELNRLAARRSREKGQKRKDKLVEVKITWVCGLHIVMRLAVTNNDYYFYKPSSWFGRFQCFCYLFHNDNVININTDLKIILCFLVDITRKLYKEP